MVRPQSYTSSSCNPLSLSSLHLRSACTKKHRNSSRNRANEEPINPKLQKNLWVAPVALDALGGQAGVTDAGLWSCVLTNRVEGWRGGGRGRRHASIRTFKVL